MFATISQASRRIFIFQVLALFLPLALLVNGAGLFFYQTKKTGVFDDIRENEAANVKIGKVPITYVFEELSRDIRYLSQSFELKRFIEKPTPEATRFLAEDMFNLSRASRIYDKVRWLDETGMERIRVNFNDGNPALVPADQLQYKGDRYFFTDVYKLNPGEIYISPFDLNVEQGKLEIPYKPAIRIGVPVSDSHGRKRGIVLLNYLGVKLLTRFNAVTVNSADHIMLLNRDGYWLKSPRHEDEWGFMFKRDNLTLARSHPAVWQRIAHGSNGQFEDADGLWTFDTVHPLAEGQKTSSGTAEISAPSGSVLQDYEYQWKVVSHLPPGILYKNINSLRNLLLAADAVLMLLLFAISWAMMYFRNQHAADVEQIKNLAFYDPLTSLPNRRLLLDRLQQAMAVSTRSGRHGALLFLDLDHFKTINDTQGHAMGDKLLIEVAHRLQTCVRESDSVARLGGDEFVVVLEGLSSDANEAASQTEPVAEKIRSELGQPYALNDFECLTTPSIGISLFRGHLESVENLLKHADVAMYQAKAAGRNAIRFFDPQMQTVLDMRAVLEKDLRQALEKQQFHLYYQIQVDSLRRPLGAELLLRWDHPERGLVSPAQFISLAEETGLILPIGLWVLQTACAQLKEWQHDALTRNLTLAVNVSAKQFHQADFVAQVQRVLLESGAKPSLLKLELTESTVLGNVHDTIAKMREIKMLGVSFSMDDFGTGYSSLQYLKRLPLNQIKIDQSFVRDITNDPNDAAIVAAIIAMTDALGMNVIAEGVETEAQREFLDDHGCHAFQGYLFSKPVPIGQFESMLRGGVG